MSYDAAGQLATQVDARSVRASYSYDAAGRLTLRRFSDGTRVTFSYDAVGNRTAMRDSTGITTYTYNAVNQTSGVTNPLGKAISYRYDTRGLRRGMTDPDGGRFTYSYDPVGRIRSVQNSTVPGNSLTTFVYDAAGQMVLRESPLLQIASHVYDDAGRLVDIYNGHAINTSFFNSRFTYTYDKVGNRRQMRETGGVVNDVVTWTYDKAYQLTREARGGTNNYDLTHGYDPVGNRLKKVDNATGAITTFVYDAANQLATSQDAGGTTTFSYDAAGNLQLQQAPTGTTTNTWDAENRLTLVQLPTAVRNTFTYTGDGLRFQKQDSTGTTRFVWDGHNYLMELDGTSATRWLYTQTPDTYGLLLSRRSGALNEYYSWDALGSIAALTISPLSLRARYIYRAFGESTRVGGTADSPFRWVGQLGYYHDLDLLQYYLRARQYSPALARFLSQDPIGFRGGDTNLFRYVGNNAVNWNDPSGMAAREYFDPPLPLDDLPCYVEGAELTHTFYRDLEVRSREYVTQYCPTQRTLPPRFACPIPVPWPGYQRCERDVIRTWDTGSSFRLVCAEGRWSILRTRLQINPRTRRTPWACGPCEPDIPIRIETVA